MKESDLFPPIEKYLKENGYTVNCEVQHCDIVAQKEDELIAIEMKKRFNATLLIQAVERQKFADSVYIAILRPKTLEASKNWRGMCHLLKRLEIGLILVDVLKTKTKVEIAFHPAERVVRKNKKKRKIILQEIEKRSGNYNKAGISKKKIITAYRENALFIACCLEKFGQLSPKKLRELGTGDKTSSILTKNFYKWFERVDRGIYELTESGKQAMETYKDVVDFYDKKLKGKSL